MNNTLAIIAGNGSLPLVCATAAQEAGVRLVAIAIREETDPALEKIVERTHWIHVGQLTRLIELLVSEQVRQAVMVGQIRHRLLFENIKIDPALADLLKQVPDHRTDTILGAIAAQLQQRGIKLLDSSTFLKQMMPDPGVLTGTEPSAAQREDIAFGLKMAKAIAGLDIGQTVVVKDKTVLSVEAIEGTDEAVRRATQFCHQGAVVVKVSKPAQDMRFDVPLIGRTTIDTLCQNNAAVLAIEAGATLLLDREYCLTAADKHGIAIIAV